MLFKPGKVNAEVKFVLNLCTSGAKRGQGEEEEERELNDRFLTVNSVGFILTRVIDLLVVYLLYGLQSLC